MAAKKKGGGQRKSHGARQNNLVERAPAGSAERKAFPDAFRIKRLDLLDDDESTLRRVFEIQARAVQPFMIRPRLPDPDSDAVYVAFTPSSRGDAVAGFICIVEQPRVFRSFTFEEPVEQELQVRTDQPIV